jgi:drug/metabolite transporter (DMT)-like permease
LKEKIKPLQWLFFVISLMGVFVIKGFDNQLNTTGLILVMLASILSGLVYIIISKIGKSEHPIVIVNYFMVFATILGGVLSINNWVTPEGNEWFFLMILGVFGYFGQVYMTKAFQTASANIIAPIKYVEVIYTATFGVLLFKEIYTFYSFLGIALIIGGLILNIWYKSKFKDS